MTSSLKELIQRDAGVGALSDSGNLDSGTLAELKRAVNKFSIT